MNEGGWVKLIIMPLLVAGFSGWLGWFLKARLDKSQIETDRNALRAVAADRVEQARVDVAAEIGSFMQPYGMDLIKEGYRPERIDAIARSLDGISPKDLPDQAVMEALRKARAAVVSTHDLFRMLGDCHTHEGDHQNYPYPAPLFQSIGSDLTASRDAIKAAHRPVLGMSAKIGLWLSNARIW